MAGKPSIERSMVLHQSNDRWQQRYNKRETQARESVDTQVQWGTTDNIRGFVRKFDSTFRILRSFSSATFVHSFASCLAVPHTSRSLSLCLLDGIPTSSSTGSYSIMES